MNLEQLFQNFQYDDLQWFIPVIAGLLIIVGGLLIGMIRGITAGLIVALFFGGLMCMSPVILNALQRQATSLNLALVEVTRSAAALTSLNNEMISELSRVVNSMRIALDTVGPLLENPGGADDGSEDGNSADNELSSRFSQSLSASADRLNVVSDNVAEGQVLIRRLDANVQALEGELRRASPPR